MTERDDMPDNPGDPENTDPEATSAESAEQAAEEAAAAQESSDEPELDPTLEADVDAALAEPDPEADAKVDEAEAAEVVEEGPTVEEQLAERTEDLQRLNAEYINYRRRVERERQAVVDGAKAKVLTEMLPILDDLELARQHGDLDEGPLKAISDKLQSVLDNQGLQPFGAEGDAFDPEVHEAVQDLSTGGAQAVGTVLRRGFKVGDRVVRNALVIIADASTDEESGEASE
ncbi:nucleotide exchange factor GrpE [Corynebacterium incognita]|uniref:Protein GrpE n=1 Tax=Corynebacterium incognita TaxID=2754725 RepID=A0A7G7CRL4_9CORY|nr:nucleotide exchange factor GrpE [Corynebacterium incognita]QNE90230.1 nucleotide exchange factor GrpE [Corynebacterium incognita]